MKNMIICMMISELANLDIYFWNNYLDYLDLPSLSRSMTPIFSCTWHFCYVDLCNQVWFCKSTEVRLHMIKRKEKLWKMTTSLTNNFAGLLFFLDFCFLVRCQVISLLEEDETISKKQPETFC